MKKIIVPILACMLTSGIYAQKAVEGVKFTDNWSVGVNAGVTSPLGAGLSRLLGLVNLSNT